MDQTAPKVNETVPKDDNSEKQPVHDEELEEQEDQSLTKKQKENLKKKQKKKQKKENAKTQDEQETPVEPQKVEESKENKEEGEESEQPESSASTTDNSTSDFDKELEWCIKQIRLGLSSNAISKDQMHESLSVLSVLESTTAPLPKKRHLMKVVFGDYRKLMKSMK